MNLLETKLLIFVNALIPAWPVKVFAFPELTINASISLFFKFFSFQSSVHDLNEDFVKTSATEVLFLKRNKAKSSRFLLYKPAEYTYKSMPLICFIFPIFFGAKGDFFNIFQTIKYE